MFKIPTRWRYAPLGGVVGRAVGRRPWDQFSELAEVWGGRTMETRKFLPEVTSVTISQRQNVTLMLIC